MKDIAKQKDVNASAERSLYMGFHALDWVIILVVALVIFGPKVVQSVARNAGKTMGQARTAREKVMAELPLEEFSEISRQIPRIPRNPYQVVEMLMTPESGTEPVKKVQEPEEK